MLTQAGSILSVAWSPDSSRLITGGSDGTARVWEIREMEPRELMSLPAQETNSLITGVAFSPDGTRVMASDADTSLVKIWDVGPVGDAEWANVPVPGASLVEFMPDGPRLATGTLSGDVVTIRILTPDVTFGRSDRRATSGSSPSA